MDLNHHLHNWPDYVRVVGFLVSLYSVAKLILRYRTTNGRDWNVKTKDSWYALLTWSISGCVFTVQAIVLNRPVTPGFVFLMAAILVTGKSVHQKGDWGNRAS